MKRRKEICKRGVRIKVRTRARAHEAAKRWAKAGEDGDREKEGRERGQERKGSALIQKVTHGEKKREGKRVVRTETGDHLGLQGRDGGPCWSRGSARYVGGVKVGAVGVLEGRGFTLILDTSHAGVDVTVVDDHWCTLHMARVTGALDKTENQPVTIQASNFLQTTAQPRKRDVRGRGRARAKSHEKGG